MTKQVKCMMAWAAAVLLSWAGLPASGITPGSVPAIESVQARMWKNMKLADYKLQGSVRTDGGKRFPITLCTKGYELIYDFAPEPLQIRVMIDPAQSTVETRKSGKEEWKPLSKKEMQKNVLGTDITYEDLALDLIRWEKVTPLGTDSFKTFDTWVYEAEPSGPSQYAKARYWISTKYYAFIKIDGCNAKGDVTKRVEVNGVKKIGKAFVLEEMVISTLKPGSDVSSSRTWVDIRDGEEGASGLP
jgi:Outer membrane lipoprotein-sorting protein